MKDESQSLTKSFVFPASFAQRGLWFHEQMEPGDPSYNVPFAMRISGPLNVPALQHSLQAIVDRHESLRTHFMDLDGEPQQVIEDHVTLKMVPVDLSSLADRVREPEMQRLIQEEAERPFDLRYAPLLRATLLKLHEQNHVLVLNMHHIVTDHWSRWVLFSELGKLYEAFAQNQPSPLAALPIQYADFSEWQRNTMESEEIKSQLDYWKKQLTGSVVPELPTDRPRPATLSRRGTRVLFEFPPQLSAALKDLCRRQGVTLYMTLLAAFQTLIYRYTGQEDICVGSPIAGRARYETESLIGLFTNTLVVRTNISGDKAFVETLKEIKQIALGAYSHQDIPFEKLVETLVPQRQISRTPMFQVMFNLQNAPPPLLQFGEAKVERVFLHTRRSIFDISWEMEEFGTQLGGAVEYNSELFDAATIDRMIGHYRVLLSGIVADPQQPLFLLPLMDARERAELATFNPPPVSPQNTHVPWGGGATLHGLFEGQVERFGNRIALRCGAQSWTYSEVNSKANRLARELVKCGVKADTLVGLCVDRSQDVVISILAILKAGGAYLPIDLAYPAERTAFMLEDAQVPVLLTQSNLLGSLPPTQAKVVCVDKVLGQPAEVGEETNLPATAAPDDLAYVIYTSGTTGKPKGSLITHRNVARLFAAAEAWYEFNDKDVWTLFHSCAFDFSVWEIWGALLYGGSVVVVPFMVSRSPEAFYELLAKEGVTVLNQTPSAFRQLIQAEETVGQRKLDLRYVIFGGEALEMQSLRPWFERHGDQTPKLVNMYGITETTVHVTYRPLSKNDVQSGSVIGVPIPDLQVYILDSHRQQVPVGVPGEMYVGGAGLARGYLRRPELTAERFISNPFTADDGSRLYKTGDLARFLVGGDIEYLGRIDQQVKIRGFRIELGEIESVLCEHPAVREAIIQVRSDTPDEKRLVAYVVASSADAGVLREHVKKKLPDYMVPAAWVFLDQIPLTASGKVDHKLLPAPQVRVSAPIGNLSPQTEMEKLIAGLWQGMLHLEHVSIEDNFFDLGGTSLLIVQMHRRLRETLKANLSVVSLFEHPTIRSLALHLAQSPDSEHQSSATLRERAGRQREVIARMQTKLRKQEK